MTWYRVTVTRRNTHEMAAFKLEAASRPAAYEYAAWLLDPARFDILAILEIDPAYWTED